MPTTDDLVDRLLSDDIDLARLEASEQRRVLRLLEQLRRDIRVLLQRHDPTGVQRVTFQRRRLEAMLPDVTAAIRRAYRSLNRTQEATLREIAALTGQQTAATVNTVLASRLLTAGLNEARLHALVDDLALEGASAQEWWSRQAGTLRQRWHDQMRQGLSIGEQLSQLIQRTQTVTRQAIRPAEALTRTALLSVNNTARNAVYAANSDVVESVQWITALDTRVCPICRALSAKRWTVPDHRLVGHRLPWPGVIAHFSCRCTQVPVVTGMAPATDLSFTTWLRKQSVAQQRAILGLERYELWHTGTLRLDQMVDQRHRPLTLAELQAKVA